MLSGRTATVTLLFVAVLLGASMLAVDVEAQRIVPGTARTDTLATANYAWIVENTTDHVDLIGTPVTTALPHLAARFDLRRTALEAVYATPRDDTLEPVFQVAAIPLLLSFEPPLPIGDGLRTVEPLRLDWGVETITDETDILVVHAAADIPLPANGTSPPEDGTTRAPSGARLTWRVDVVADARPDTASGARLPAAVRALWNLELPEGLEGHEAAWRVLLESRTQNHGVLVNGTGDDRFSGVYAERAGHHAAFRLLPYVAHSAPPPGLTLGAPRDWHVVDLLRGPIPHNETVLLPLQLLATTAAPLQTAGDQVGDGVALEIGFYQTTSDPSVDGPEPVPRAGHPAAPSWWHIGLALLAVLFAVAPPGRRVRTTNA